jgi:hypothetical protein
MAAATEISSYLSNKDPAFQKVARELRSYIKKIVPGVTESVNAWHIPTFESNGPFAYFMVGKNHVTLGFHYGTSLDDPHHLLEGTGKKLRHVKLRKVEDLGQNGLRELILSAAQFDLHGSKPAMRRAR